MKENNGKTSSNQAFLIYRDDNGIAWVNVRFNGEDVWLTVEQTNNLDIIVAVGYRLKSQVVRRFH